MTIKESSFLNMVIGLMIVTLVASVSLGFVYTWTKEPIAQAALAKQRRAIHEVIKGFTNDPLQDGYKVVSANGRDSLEFFPAKKDGEIIGTAVKTFSSRGYSGEIWLMVGFDTHGKIIKTAVLKHSETPGLGSKMSSPDFMNQFTSIDPGARKIKMRKDGGEIDAISGATISSRAFSEAVQLAYDTYITQQHGN